MLLNMDAPLRILIADSHPMFGRGLRHLIEDMGWSVTQEAATAAAALKLVRELRPDVAVLNSGLPGMTGLEVARAIRNQFFARVILCTDQTENSFREAFEAGVVGYLLREDSAEVWREALQTVVRGDFYITPSLVSGVLRSRLAPSPTETPGINNLTRMERRVLQSISANKSSLQIAQEFFISIHTVDTHRRNICAKLKLRGNNTLLRFALQHREQL
jgi:DNA-binding NarL/FixJ family response regulator